MRYLKVAGAALNQTPLDWKGNRARIVEAIHAAQAEGVQVLCLPELCISGYGCEDAFHGEWVAEESLRSLAAILPETRGIAVAVGLPIIHRQNLYNTAALLVDGRLAGFFAKQVLAGYGVYYEPRWFKAWPGDLVDEHEWGGQSYPFGDVVFELGGVRLGFEICEDAWARRGIAANPVTGRADVLLNPSASHFAAGKYETVRGIVREGSRQGHAAYLYANLLGNEAGRLIFDGTVLIASDGHLLAENRRFSYRATNLVTAIVDLRANRLERRRISYPVVRNGDAKGAVSVPFTPREPEARELRTALAAPPPQPAGLPREEAFAAAVSLGLWDYLRKSRSRGFALSISGGVDSAAVAVLCWVMASRALAELGAAGVHEALGYLDDLPALEGLPPAEAARALTRRLLLTVYQGSANSSDVTRTAARGVAEAIGARHLELDIQPLVERYEALAAEAIGRPLRWETDDIARQNIQARVRSPGIWLLANLEGRLLLSTSNRSEVGVGYATMDGDTSGGLAPIAGANKTFLRAWLAWMEREGLPGLGPLPALAAVNVQAPTAELRPGDQRQEDEKDLMPYPVLDAIEQAAIRDRMAPVEVWRTLMARPPAGRALPPRDAAAFVATFFRLWSHTQWKRERIAPSFHLDDENLDPRTWCRFPILAGGYETEIEELWRVVEAE
ncbi:MAG TPA: NAD(+) synthase [bacterium]|nr:NAD(+) synthase [bacterium]